MDFVQLARGLLPQSFGGRVGIGALGLIGATYVLSWPYNLIHYHREEKYRLSVCWEQYLAYNNASEESYKYSPREINRRKMMYNECICSARKGTKIYPPAL
ncbi:unnamed protein product [Blepharisma stoltei]|uniref:Uncharacterized protein n=1 Tax=Blepharisma stoltei TaxID=1481888 RepID=A0AAU9JPS9_9CILI|nr:unnamed protein product [Blepharisma stoltei]